MVMHPTRTPLQTAGSRAASLAALLLAALAILVLSGCGSSGDADGGASDTAAPAGAATGDEDAARVKLAQCLREHGVELPDNVGQGGAPPRDINLDEVRELMRGECREFAAGGPAAIDSNDPEFRDAFAVFAQCMREHGVELPDITGEGGGGPARIDLSDPDLQAAREACRDKLPQGLRAGRN